MVEDIQKSILSYDNICGVHDLMIHNYGPGRIIASIHAESTLQYFYNKNS